MSEKNEHYQAAIDLIESFETGMITPVELILQVHEHNKQVHELYQIGTLSTAYFYIAIFKTKFIIIKF